MNELLETAIYHNTLGDYLITAGIIFVSFTLIWIFRRMILKRLRRWSEKTGTTLDDFIVNQAEKFAAPLLYSAAVYFSVHYLTLSETVLRVLQSLFTILMTVYAARFIIALLKYLLESFWSKKEPAAAKESIKGISGFIAILVWGLSTVFLLDNLGFKISTIVAGLGIGGIAVALAAQAILGDLFSYFVIFFDRPFQVGDFIVVDTKVGVVEYIGIKTTRIKSLSGEEIVISNKDLTDSRLHNFKKMERRRALFTIGVTYQTPLDQVREIPGLIKKIIDDQQNATFDRAHFKEYGNFSLNFEVVYYVIGADYNQYMDIQQGINLKIYEEFAARKIEFAYPTQTVFVQSENKN